MLHLVGDGVRAAHEHGIYVILDIIAHHTGNVFTYAADRYTTRDPGSGRWYNDPRWDGRAYAVKGFNDKNGQPTLPFGPPGDARLEAAWPNGAIWPREFQRPELYFRKGHIGNWDYSPEYLEGDMFGLKTLDLRVQKDGQYLRIASVLPALALVYGFWIAYADVDGFRIDAIKHLNWGWQYSLANSIYTFGDSFLFGEWFQGNTSDPLYADAYKFANKSGISMLDFPLNTAIRNVFGSNANFSEIDSVISTEGSNFTWKEDLVTFIDNHDMARFLSINNKNNRLHEALAFTLTSRGIPCIYYGTEQYLHNDTSGGTDPYNRPMMTNFSTSTTAYQLVNKLSTLRRNNTALAYGSMSQRWINNDVYIFERKFFGNVVFVGEFSRVMFEPFDAVKLFTDRHFAAVVRRATKNPGQCGEWPHRQEPVGE